MKSVERESAAPPKPRRKVYVIEWLHKAQREWYPILAETKFRVIHTERKERADMYPQERFRVRKYYAARAED